MIAVRLFQALTRYYLKLRQLKLEMCWAQSLGLCYAFFSPKKASSFLYLIYIQQKFNL
ncbi:hypothetical protein ACINIS251_1941 [Acinetobacter baumannii IS-251]|uniref:Uncharacterized protein n=1 Tax=Acinetobacter baumannii MRSN 3527 TaxID=1409923 RepID=A0A0J0ZNK9_ACIBA|nr:hypothetical protein ACINBC5_A2203 [Acinetobacter baumannii Canada BC-5]EKA72062.1 hypothetical protein ACINIS58_1985 [Acinetobacter baumannii IS-58]EKK08745.1 hypothetical protein ACINIS235_1972 [Acinetobacter baumannii IS-235]EKK17955.1 hypothetical protein ACINIS251_1941 [Acinetobacter baumannii IS-251]EKL54452.1 hypothetical protein ACINNAV83_2138 [Acinetobacter baumannii Naval-83]EKP57531.1 hypothetical protein ACINCANBC1_2077 [Acinetobacter baumannii Canada BC1]KGP64977.1 putative N-